MAPRWSSVATPRQIQMGRSPRVTQRGAKVKQRIRPRSAWSGWIPLGQCRVGESLLAGQAGTIVGCHQSRGRFIVYPPIAWPRHKVRGRMENHCLDGAIALGGIGSMARVDSPHWCWDSSSGLVSQDPAKRPPKTRIGAGWYDRERCGH